MTLNKEQSLVVKDILTRYATSKQQVNLYRLQGEPGTGKTYTTCNLLFHLGSKFPRAKILVICLSHQALENFKSNAIKVNKAWYQHGTANGLFTFKTIASALKAFRIGWKSYAKCQGDSLLYYDFVIVDEFSNVGDSKTKVILSGLKPYSHCLFTGDYEQLPPVMDASSAIAKLRGTGIDSVYGSPIVKYELRTQMRQPGILETISKTARDRVYLPQPNDPQIMDYSYAERGKVKFYYSEDDFLNSAKGYILKDTTSAAIISWRNKHVERLAKIIRDDIYTNYRRRRLVAGDDSPDSTLFLDGETLIVTSGNATFNRGEYITIDKLRSENWNGIEVLEHRLETGNECGFLHKNQKAMIDSIMLKYENKYNETLDRNYLTPVKYFKEFAFLGYPYSVTAHSCQGITVPQAFVNLRDLRQCTSFKKNILMVAYSRAQEGLHILY